MGDNSTPVETPGSPEPEGWYARALGDLSPGLLLRLGIMMFLQYAIWGAWTPVLALHLEDLGFSGMAIGATYSLLFLACIVTPFIGGQFADRWVPTQYVVAVLHFISGFCLWRAAWATDFGSLWPLMLGSGLAYAPTLALTNSLAFHHLSDNERQFGAVRVFGTIGWIAAGSLLTAWSAGKLGGLGIVPWRDQLAAMGLAPDRVALLRQSDCLILAAVFSGILGVISLTLPHTPPRKEAKSPWAFLEATKMLKHPNFLFFIIVAFVVATELQFYYILSAPFLNDLGIPESYVPLTKTLAQWAEILVMAIALPVLLPRLGVGKTLAIGVIAWPIRYIVFSIGSPVWLVVASLSLHGVCYVFFFTVSQVYVDNVASAQIRASAQSMLALITLGLGNFIGTYFAGFISGFFTEGTGKDAITNWTGVFLVPVFITVCCAVLFLLFFREPPRGEKIA